MANYTRLVIPVKYTRKYMGNNMGKNVPRKYKGNNMRNDGK